MRNINGKKRGKRINERFYGFHFAFLFRETSSITEGSRPVIRRISDILI